MTNIFVKADCPFVEENKLAFSGRIRINVAGEAKILNWQSSHPIFLLCQHFETFFVSEKKKITLHKQKSPSDKKLTKEKLEAKSLLFSTL